MENGKVEEREEEKNNKKKLLFAILIGLAMFTGCQDPVPIIPPGEKLPTIQMTTETAAGSPFGLAIMVDAADQADAWIDLNNNATKDAGEDVQFSADNNDNKTYTLGAQTITIHGKVTQLSCDSKKLTSLIISSNTALSYLRCSFNKFTSLDVSGCQKLAELLCYRKETDGPALSNLTVAGCSELWQLHFYGCRLTGLDITGCSKLRDIRGEVNSITASNMTAFINALPDRTSLAVGRVEINTQNTFYGTAKNATPTSADITTANGKNWKLYQSDASWTPTELTP